MVGPGMPFGIGTALGAALTVPACLLAAAVPAADPTWRLVIVTAVVGCSSAAAADAATAIAVAGAAFLLVDGFLIGRYGDLAWHGRADLVRLAALLAAAVVGAAMGRLRLWLRREQAFAPVEAWANHAPANRAPANRSRTDPFSRTELSSRLEEHT